MRSSNRFSNSVLIICLINFLVVSVSGLMLRAAPIYGIPFDFGNFLHGHSHFAFGGWITPALLWAIMHEFPDLVKHVSSRHWRNIFALLFISAYGMLFTFPLQGYGTISIAFSSLSIAATVYLAVILWRTLSNEVSISSFFLRAAVVFLVISAIGPLATAPLAKLGFKDLPVYRNAVYYYLHFQYNGWFSFVVFALMTRNIVKSILIKYTFLLLTAGCILTVFLSFLWSTPEWWYYMAGGIGAFAQLAGVLLLLKSVLTVKKLTALRRILLSFSISALLIKSGLQLLSAIPALASMASSNHQIIIAYLHLCMLGFVSAFIIYVLINKFPAPVAVYLYIAAFVSTEVILVATTFLSSAFTFSAHILLVWASTLFPIAILLLLAAVVKKILFRPAQGLRPMVNAQSHLF